MAGEGERAGDRRVNVNPQIVAQGVEVIATVDARFFRQNPFDIARPNYYVDTHFDKPGDNHGVRGVAVGIERSRDIGMSVRSVLEGDHGADDVVIVVLRKSAAGDAGKRVLALIGEINAEDSDKQNKDAGTQQNDFGGNGRVRP